MSKTAYINVLNIVLSIMILFVGSSYFGLLFQSQISATTIHEIAPPCDFNKSITTMNSSSERDHVGNTSLGRDANQAVDVNSSDCENTKIYASISGTVTIHDYTLTPAQLQQCPAGSEANYSTLTITNGDLSVVYLHHNKNTSFINESGALITTASLNNQTVKVGQQIGVIDSIGCSSGPHIHFEARWKNAYMDNADWAFKIAKPELITPFNNITTSFIELDWRDDPISDRYEVMIGGVSYSTNPTLPNYREPISSSNKSSMIFQKGEFTNPENIIWKVRSLTDQGDIGEYSLTRTFNYKNDRVEVAINGNTIVRVYSDNITNSFADKTILTERGTINLDGSITWTNTNSVGGSKYNSRIVYYNGYFYQSAVGNTNSEIFNRYSNDGINWSTWTPANSGSAASDVTMIVHNGKLHQTIAGNSGKVFTRLILTPADLVTKAWSETPLGYAASDISSTEFNGVLYQSVVGSSGGLFYRKFDNSNNTWSKWLPTKAGIAKQSTNATIIEFDGYLVQAIVGSSGTPYITFTTNPELNFIVEEQNGTIVNWPTDWTSINTDTNGIDINVVTEVDMQVFNNQLYLSVRDNNGSIYTLSISSGQLLGNTHQWEQITGISTSMVNMSTANGYLYYFTKDQTKLNSSIYNTLPIYKYSSNTGIGSNWL